MRKVLFFFGFLMVMAVLFWIVTLFLPSRITVLRSQDIHASRSRVDSQIGDFDNWENWYPAFSDSNVRVQRYRRNDTSFALLSRKGTSGPMLLSLFRSANGDIHVQLPGDNEDYLFVLRPGGPDDTQVTWFVNLDLGSYPWKKFAGIFFDKANGSKYEAVLTSLKTYLENPPGRGRP